jgi:four helix bundle protein
MAVLSYRDLHAWQKARLLAGTIYQITKLFPADERFGLTMQMRRSAISIASNIAEGQGRGRGIDFVRFLRIANASRQELETQLIISNDIGLLRDEQLAELLTESASLGRLLRGLARSIHATRTATPTNQDAAAPQGGT